MTKSYFFETALIGERFETDVVIDVAKDGAITRVQAGATAEGARRVKGVALPGMANLHSHAIQRAMAGRAEARSPHPEDTFWTWRDKMYAFALKATPDDLRAVATKLYIDMLKAGFTSVAEFHYLHHDLTGALYASPTEMSDAILDAADNAGLALTHLPVLYQYANFGREPTTFEQRRFRCETDEFLGLLDALAPKLDGPDRRLGVAFHSLRAVDEDGLTDVLSYRKLTDNSTPVHIHIAEQPREVEDCLQHTGARPVEWLFDNAPVDETWCLVHMTHAAPHEWKKVAAADAVAGLCPTTEANLGDGVFAFADYAAAGGGFGIGSDSHIDVSAREELRMLEYGQRLATGRRAVGASADGPSPGASLWARAADGGAHACGRHAGALSPGRRADIVVLDDQHAAFYATATDDIADAFVFTGDSTCVKEVMVGGRWIVKNGRHSGEKDAETAYRAAVKRILGAL